MSIICSNQGTTDRLAVLAFNIAVGDKVFAAAQLVDIPDSPVKAAVGTKTLARREIIELLVPVR